MISQYGWRAAGAVFLVICLALVVMSPVVIHTETSILILSLYWGIFTFLLLAALYIAFLDIRYTRLQYKLNERELFRETFMTDEFRQALHQAVKENAAAREHPEKSNPADGH